MNKYYATALAIASLYFSFYMFDLDSRAWYVSATRFLSMLLVAFSTGHAIHVWVQGIKE